MKTKTKIKIAPDWLDRVFDAVEKHGEMHDWPESFEYMVGDLEILVADMWKLLPQEAKAKLARTGHWQDFLERWEKEP